MTTPQQARAIADMLQTDIPAGAVEAFRSLASQVEALTAELESWRFTNRIDELQRTHDSYKKDAERYRWLRSQDWVTVSMSWQMPFPKNHIQGQPMTCKTATHGRLETLDKIVDQAIAKGTAND